MSSLNDNSLETIFLNLETLLSPKACLIVRLPLWGRWGGEWVDVLPFRVGVFLQKLIPVLSAHNSLPTDVLHSRASICAAPHTDI